MFRKSRRNDKGKDQILAVKHNRGFLCGGDHVDDLRVTLGCHLVGITTGGNGVKGHTSLCVVFL